MQLAASYLLGHPNWRRPDPGLRPRCEEEIETTEHALLRCPARQHASGSFPETLDLRSAWYDATATGMLAKSVRCTLTAYPPGFTPPVDNGTPTPSSVSPPSCLGSALLISTAFSDNCTVWHVSLGSFFWCSLVFSSILFPFHLFSI